jgi:DnaJ-class molecular chaperone
VGVDEVIPKFGVAMRCVKCNGEGWLKRQKDVGRIYGKPHSVTVTRVCDKCNGKGRIAEMPLFAAREDGGKYEGLQGI